MMYMKPHSRIVVAMRRTYIHRVGRTARMGKGGTAVTIMLKHEVRHFKSLVRKNASSSLINFSLDSSVIDRLRVHFDTALGMVERGSTVAAPKRRRKHDDALAILISQARRHARHPGGHSNAGLGESLP